MTGLIVIDLLECLMTNRIVHCLQQEGAERAIQRYLEHRNDSAKHVVRHLVGVAIEPLNDQTQVNIWLWNIFPIKHAPTLHQSHLGIGMTLLFGMKIAVQLT